MKRKALTYDNVYMQFLQELYRGFDWLNVKFAQGKLPRPVITVATALGNIDRMAHFQHDIWQQGDKMLHEIHLVAEHLVKGVYETMDSLAHETAHLANFHEFKKVMDVAPETGRHNLRYKRRAEQFGLRVEQHPQKGYAITHLTPELRTAIDNEFKPNMELFKLYRKAFNAMRKRKKKDKGKLAHVMTDQDTKQLIEHHAKDMKMTQKDFTRNAARSYAMLPKRIKAASERLAQMTDPKKIEEFLLKLLMERETS